MQHLCISLPQFYDKLVKSSAYGKLLKKLPKKRPNTVMATD